MFTSVVGEYVKEIIHQIQPTETTCAHTCLSMLTGVPVEKIIEEFGEGGLDTIRETNFLIRHGYFPIQIKNDPYIGWSFPRQGRYFLTVYSLNKIATTHRILVEVDKDYNEIVYDPNQGKEGKEFYKDDDGAVTFRVVEIFYLDRHPSFFRGLYKKE